MPFSSFFASDTTPAALIKAGIYSTIAVPLKGGAWREASMATMVRTLALPPSRSLAKVINLNMAKEPPRGLMASLRNTSMSCLPRRSMATKASSMIRFPRLPGFGQKGVSEKVQSPQIPLVKV